MRLRSWSPKTSSNVTLLSVGCRFVEDPEDCHSGPRAGSTTVPIGWFFQVVQRSSSYGVAKALTRVPTLKLREFHRTIIRHLQAPLRHVRRHLLGFLSRWWGRGETALKNSQEEKPWCEIHRCDLLLPLLIRLDGRSIWGVESELVEAVVRTDC